ncbi:MAG: hypothetical protein Q9165_002997 [Trypethelium subeluteriae]
MATINYRTIDIDALDPDSAANFDLSTLAPDVVPVSTADVQTLAGQIRQLLRGGETEGALRGALENVPYGADQQGKGMSSRQPSSSKNLSPQATGFSQIQARGGGEGGGQAMSVLLSWHEKVCRRFPSTEAQRISKPHSPSLFIFPETDSQLL